MEDKMTEKKFVFLMFEKAQVLTNKIKNYYNISFAEARKIFYNSNIYKALEKEETKMWYYSSFDLFNMFLEEQKTGTYSIYGG